MTSAILVVKIFLDGAAAISLSLDDNWAMACMFAGFALADVGAFWVALK